MKRRRLQAIVGALGIFALSGCGAMTSYYLQPCPTGSGLECHPEEIRDQATTAGEIDVSLFLVGDAGDPEEMGRRSLVLRHLEAGLAEPVPDKRIVFLGDNVYPDGLRGATHAECHEEAPPGAPYCLEDQAQLDAQLAILGATDSRAYFIPGNHDWANTRGREGYEILHNQETYLSDKPAVMQPRAGCPGPVREIAMGGGEPRVHLLFIDTQWLLLPTGSRPQSFGARSQTPVPECDPRDEEEVYARLRALLGEAGDVPVVLLAHHPIRTHGRHGGFGNAAYAFGISAQDINSAPYRRLSERLESMFAAPRANLLVFAAGHDHVLQVLRDDPQSVVHVVSGAGSKDVSGVESGPDTEFAAGLPGFVRLNFHRTGAVFLYVYAGCHMAMEGDPSILEPTCAANEFAVVHAMRLR